MAEADMLEMLAIVLGLLCVPASAVIFIWRLERIEQLGPARRGRTGHIAYVFMLASFVAFSLIMVSRMGAQALIIVIILSFLAAAATYRMLRPDYVQDWEEKRTFPALPWRIALILMSVGAVIFVLGAALVVYDALALGSAMLGAASTIIFFTFLAKTAIEPR